MFNLIKKLKFNKKYLSIFIAVLILISIVGFSYAQTKKAELEVDQVSDTIVVNSDKIVEEGEVAGVQEENETDKTVTTKTNTSVPTNTPIVSPTAIPIQNTAPVVNNTNNFYRAPTTTPVATTAPVDYSEALRQAQEVQADNARKQELCSQWAKERDAALAPLKQEVNSLYQKYQDEVTATENNSQLSSVQKSQRKSDLMVRYLTPYNEANIEYINALNAYGSCPYF